MLGLFVFLYRLRVFLIFLLLEAIGLTLLVNNNSFQAATYFHTSNQVVGSVLKAKTDVVDYFNLQERNEVLAEENARLHAQINQLFILSRQNTADTLKSALLDSFLLSHNKGYQYLAARVVNNSYTSLNNYITINKGRNQGVKPEMGVLSASGLVGRVMFVSDNFSTIKSILNTKSRISVAIKGINGVGTLRWDGGDPTEAILEFVPRHLKVKEGDSLQTAANSSLFPEGLMVGTIKEVELKSSEPFYSLKVNLSTDFSNLSFIYLLDNPARLEQDSLERLTDPNYNSINKPKDLAK